MFGRNHDTRAPARWLLAALLATVLPAACQPGAKLPDRNVILISIDSLRADHLGCYGYDQPTSPNIDRLAATGVRFDRAYATSPWTLPSHASMFTGLYADTHGVYSANSALKKDATTLPAVLRKAGYQTAAVVCAPLLKKRYGLHHGFELYDVELIGANAKKARAVKVGPSVTKKALAWLDGRGEKPFFLFLHYWDPHYDYNPPQKYVDLFDPDYEGKEDGIGIYERTDINPSMDPRDLKHLVALFDGEIRYTDDAVGTLLAGLAERGLDRNTAVLLVADHGEEFLEHGWKGHTRTCYEELIRIPFIARVPWLEKGPAVVDDPVSLVDIFPTVLSLLGRPREGLKLQGSDLGRAIAQGASLPQRSLTAETRQGEPVPRGKGYRWSALLTKDSHKLHRLGRGTDVRWNLFELATDPGEQRDLANEKTELRDKLATELDRRRTLHGQLRKVLKAGEETELDAELAETLKGLGYLQ